MAAAKLPFAMPKAYYALTHWVAESARVSMNKCP
jgi:hypothetical protein